MSRIRLTTLLLGWLTAASMFLDAPARAWADDSIPVAQKLRLTGKYKEAAEVYERLVEKHPVAAALGLARCRQAVGEIDEAEKILRDAARQHRSSAALPAELARLSFQRGSYDAARQGTEAALQLDQNQLTARWLDAELQRTAGRLEQANRAYEWFIDYYNATDEIEQPDDLRWIGLAAAQFARWNRSAGQFSFLVNQLYPEALKRNENYWPAHLEAGLLFLEKYNQADAAAELTAALEMNPHAAEIHAARAMLALQNYELDRAGSSIAAALAINPHLLWAHQLKADLLLSNFRAAEAVHVLEAVRRLNPASEETLGRLAGAYGAVDGLAGGKPGKRMRAVIDQAVKRNEHCGQFFAAMAGTLDRIRKFPAAVKYYQQASRRMPQLVGPRGQLGMLAMRLGKEARAAKLLQQSFAIDPFNIRVKNTLAVLEVLDDYAVLETEHFVLKFDRGQDDILAKYAARYLEEEVYPDIVEQLGYKPPGKTLIEIFNRAKNTSGHGWFSARMVGLPYVGTVGACAGKMVAMVSPSAMPQKFNWARVLRHEFVHVVNLQQTDFNIPHWYTEALAVRSEGHPRPSSWNQVLARRVRAGKTFNLDTINLGFIRPASSDDWTLAYCQAELYAEYMVHAYGEDAMSRMLAAYADNLDTPAALRRSFEVEQREFEQGYSRYVHKIVEGLSKEKQSITVPFAELQKAAETDPENADLHAQLALAYLRRGAKPPARREALQALGIEQRHQLAGYVMAKLFLSIGDTQSALRQLQECLDKKKPAENALALLAGLKLKAEDYGEAARLYDLGRRHFPHQDRWLKGLARVYLKSNNQQKLVPIITLLAGRDTDAIAYRKKLAKLALAGKDYDAAAQWANQALWIDVMDADVHAVIAQARAATGQLPRAIEEYELAIRLNPRQLPWRMALAGACVQAKQPEKTRSVLEALLAVDPDYPGAEKLLESLSP